MKILTRRNFGKAVVGGALIGSTSHLLAAEADFSLVVVPDPQFLASLGGACVPYSAIMTWIVDNTATVIDGSALNIQGVVGVGDCVNTANTAAENTRAHNGWGILDSNSIPWISCIGNHDMETVAGDLSARTLGTPWQAGGFFASDTRSAKSYFGGSYDSANYYVKFRVGSRRLLVLALEFHPRTVVMDWAKGVHDAHPAWDVIVTTHSYLTSAGNQVARGTGNLLTNSFGPDNASYVQGAAPASNSGTEMWSGWFSTWRNLTMILCGHWLWTDLYGGGWVWQQVAISSSSARAQTVQQIFTNQQDSDRGIDYMTGLFGSNVPCTVGAETQHLFILKFQPATSKLRAYAVSVNTGKWIGAYSTLNSATPVRLFDVDYPGAAQAFPLPVAVGG